MSKAIFRFLLAGALVAGIFLVSRELGSDPTWIGDFDTGDFSQWFQVQGVENNCCVVEERSGHRTAARFTLRPGDVASHGERAEVKRLPDAFEGVEERWTWQVLFPRSFRTDPEAGSFNIFTQWHDSGDQCSSPIAFAVEGGTDRIVLDLRTAQDYATCKLTTRQIELGTFEKERWYGFELRVRWASDETGWLEVRRDGQVVLPKTHTATMFPGESVYLKQGFYRRPANFITQIFIDGTRGVRTEGGKFGTTSS